MRKLVKIIEGLPYSNVYYDCNFRRQSTCSLFGFGFMEGTLGSVPVWFFWVMLLSQRELPWCVRYWGASQYSGYQTWILFSPLIFRFPFWQGWVLSFTRVNSLQLKQVVRIDCPNWDLENFFLSYLRVQIQSINNLALEN